MTGDIGDDRVRIGKGIEKGVTVISIHVTGGAQMVKVAAYLRVSTDGQTGEDKFGLASQREAIESYAKREGYEIVRWYADEGISGATLDRPGLQQLLADATVGAFAVVIVAKMDRLARDLLSQLWLEKELLSAKVEIISAAEPFRGQDPASVMFRQLLGSFAQFEKARIAERLAGGRKQKAKGGGFAGGSPAIGYRAERGTKTLYVDEEKRETVRRVFSLHDQGLSLRGILRVLQAEGHTTRDGHPFTQAVQIKRIIDRRDFYAGLYQYTDIKASGKHEPILGAVGGGE